MRQIVKFAPTYASQLMTRRYLSLTYLVESVALINRV